MLFQIKSYIHFVLNLSKKAEIEASGLGQFIKIIFDKKKSFYAFITMMPVRRKMLVDGRVLIIEDLGAGSKKHQSNERKISAIFGQSVKKQKYAEMLYRIGLTTEPSKILELGTSLGVTTGYLALISKRTKVVTIEGCRAIGAIASENLKSIGVKNVEIIIGNFDNELPKLLELHQFDFIYLDGNHTEEATIRYFELLKPYINENTIIILDDIHWSEGMQKAWSVIQSSEKVTATIDLFEMGVLFFDKKYKGNLSVKY